jgi:cold shock CspA family protein
VSEDKQYRGTVSYWANSYGFIKIDGEGADDAFVHQSQLKGRRSLQRGDRVRFRLANDARRPGKMQAIDVELL